MIVTQNLTLYCLLRIQEGEAEAEKKEGNSTEEEKPKEKPKKVMHKEEVTFDPTYTFPLPMTKDDKKAAGARLDAFTEYDQNVRDRQESENKLESYLYAVKEKLEDEYIVSASTEETRTEILAKVAQCAVSRWIKFKIN